MSHFDPVEISAVLREQGFCEQDDLGLGQIAVRNLSPGTRSAM